MENLIDDTQDILTFYNKKGTIIRIINTIPTSISHKERRKIANKLGIKNWHHYMVGTLGKGMKNKKKWHIRFYKWSMFLSPWEKINLATGKII